MIIQCKKTCPYYADKINISRAILNFAEARGLSVDVTEDITHEGTRFDFIGRTKFEDFGIYIVWPEVDDYKAAKTEILTGLCKRFAPQYDSDTVKNYVENDVEMTKKFGEQLRMYKTMMNSHFGSPDFRYKIKDVIFNDPATIVFWSDGTKTVVKCQNGEEFDPEKGLAMAISKKALGNQGNYCNVFHKWLKKYEKEHQAEAEAWLNVKFSAAEAAAGIQKLAKIAKEYLTPGDKHVD